MRISVWFFAPDNLVGRAIAAVTRSPYCHVGISLDSQYYEAISSGVRTDDKLPRTAAACWTIQVDDAHAIERAQAFLAHEVGHRYSITSIVADLVASWTGQRWSLVHEGEHVCSGLVAWALVYLGLLETDAPDDETPASLAQRLSPTSTEEHPA